MGRPGAQRGFTLMELMVSVVVVAFSLSLVMGIFVSQQKAFLGMDLIRVAQEAGRDASIDFETSLRRAGWGIDPQYAFDFSYYNNCTLCRDQINKPDEIVFYARNPNFKWEAITNTNVDPQSSNSNNGCFEAGRAWSISSTTAPSASSVTINTRVGEKFVFWKGQVIQITQANGQGAYFGVVAAQTVITPPTTGTGSAVIPLDTTQKVPNPIPSSFSNASSYVALFLVDRFHYFVAAQGGTQYLMFDSGLQVGTSGATEQVPVAKNVEDFQVAYVMNARPSGTGAPDSNQNWIVGDVPGTREEPSPGATAPTYSNAATDNSRYNLSPANIRAIRYSFVIRSNLPDVSMYSPGGTNVWQGDPFPSQENRDPATAPALGGYRRLLVTGSVALRNMESRNPFIY